MKKAKVWRALVFALGLADAVGQADVREAVPARSGVVLPLRPLAAINVVGGSGQGSFEVGVRDGNLDAARVEFPVDAPCDKRNGDRDEQAISADLHQYQKLKRTIPGRTRRESSHFAGDELHVISPIHPLATHVCPTSRIAALLCGMLVVACTSQIAARSRQAGQASKVMFSESEAYEQFMGRWSRQLAASFVAFAGVHGSDDVLDVGSGTGALAAAVLSATDSGRVIGVDPSTAYAEYARTRTKSQRATFEEGDGQQLRFSNASFDKTLSLLVINFIPDPVKAVDEMVRVTRPGGTVAAAVWDYSEAMEMLRVFWDEAVALDPSSDSRDERHMPLCRPGELAALWRQCGLANVSETSLVITLPFKSFDDFWLPFLQGQGPAGAYVAALSEARRQTLRERLRKRLVPDADGSFRLTARAWAVKGVVKTR